MLKITRAPALPDKLTVATVFTELYQDSDCVVELPTAVFTEVVGLIPPGGDLQLLTQ